MPRPKGIIVICILVKAAWADRRDELAYAAGTV